MGAWILILTLLAPGDSARPGTITIVSQFSSEAACMAAANAWRSQVRAAKDRAIPLALCARSS